MTIQFLSADVLLLEVWCFHTYSFQETLIFKQTLNDIL